jgi:hypothetical protein
MKRKIYKIDYKYEKSPMNAGRNTDVYEATDALDAIKQFKDSWDAATKDGWDIKYEHITHVDCEYVGTIYSE